MLTFAVSQSAMLTMEGSSITSDPEMYDPGSQGAKDACAALNSCHGRPVGKGYSWTVTTTEAGARTIEDYCRTVGESFLSGGDVETRQDGRALIVVADRIAKLVG